MLILVFDTEEEKNCFMHLYDNYGKYIWNTIHRLIKDISIHDDLFQEILILHAHNIKKIEFEDEQRARNYVITLSKNFCLNYLKKEERSRMDFYDDMNEFNGPTREPLDWVLEEDAYQRLLGAIENLGNTYKEAMELKFVNQLDDETIAKMLGISVKNVQMRIYRGKALLKEQLGRSTDE